MKCKKKIQNNLTSQMLDSEWSGRFSVRFSAKTNQFHKLPTDSLVVTSYSVKKVHCSDAVLQTWTLPLITPGVYPGYT